MNVTDYIGTGRENATTARDFARLTGCNVREIMRAIEYERKNSTPILSTTEAPAGYYMPAADPLKASLEIQDCVRVLSHRMESQHKTLDGILCGAMNYLNGIKSATP